MKVESLKRAVHEAKRFIDAAEKIEISDGNAANSKKYYFVLVGKETAAAKRASMDLTRALAEMRKP